MTYDLFRLIIYISVFRLNTEQVRVAVEMYHYFREVLGSSRREVALTEVLVVFLSIFRRVPV
jgi:hypothetical protein